MKYYREYTLTKDTPKHKKGWPLKWSGGRNRYYFAKASTWDWEKGKPDIYLDYNGESYSIEEVQSSDWFKPVGRALPFIPKFPSKNALSEFVSLDFEIHLVDDVDECRAMNQLFDSKKFQDELYEFVKDKYNEFHKLD